MNQTNGSGLPPVLANRKRRNVMDDAVSGLGAARPAHISIAGGKFRLVNAAGAEYMVPTHHLDVIVVDANPHTSRVYYAGDFDPSNNSPPLCFSDNGTGPSKDAMAPQAPTCQVCPHNVRGSDTTFRGKPTTACSRRKKIACIIPGDSAVNVYELQIPPNSLTALKSYADWLGQQATGGGRRMDVADVVTRIEWDPDPQRLFTMVFKPVGYADDERTLQIIDYIDANKLSDVAVGRNDVACDPAMVGQQAAGQQLAPPAPQAPPAQFQLPPRTHSPPSHSSLAIPAPAPFQPPATPAVPPTAAEQAQPSSRPRGRPKKVDTTAPATAPFMSSAKTEEVAWQHFDKPTQNIPAGMPPVPDFLKPQTRLQETAEENPAPRFGMSNPPAPPAEVSEALNQAFNLPTRR